MLRRVDAAGGLVGAQGEVWSARPFLAELVFEPDVRVEVMKLEGSTALVNQ